MYASLLSPKYRKQLLYHFVGFIIVCALVGHQAFDKLEIRPQTSYIAVFNFFYLAFISYTFFAINNIYAKKIKAQSLAVGFFLGFIGFSFLTLGLIFYSPYDYLIMLASCFGAISFTLTAYGTLRWVKYNVKVKRTIRLKTEIDQLTGLYNRRAMAQHASREVRFTTQTHSALSMIMMDIDNFKSINDIHGHDVGDLVIKKLANLVKDKIRKTDAAYRWGGEEFVVMLPVTDLDEAFAVASKLLLSVEEISVGTPSGQLNITASMGVAQWQKGESLVSQTFKRADEALLEAKRLGKNRVIKAEA